MSIGIELAEGVIRAVKVDRQGMILARSERTAGPGELGTAVRDAIRAVRGTIDGAGSRAVGVATTWPDDVLPPDVSSALSDEADGSVALGAGGAAALAEAWCGAAREGKDVVVVSLGTHVIAGALVDGKVLRGAHGNAAAIGWLALNPVEREDYRRLGGLEAEVGDAGIVRRLVWRVKSGDVSSVTDEVNGDFSRITTRQILEAARAGDGVSISVMRDTVRYVAMAVANLATILDPESVVLGGTITLAGESAIEAVRLECHRRLRPADADRLRIVASTLGGDAVAIGAARAALLRDS